MVTCATDLHCNRGARLLHTFAMPKTAALCLAACLLAACTTTAPSSTTPTATPAQPDHEALIPERYVSPDDPGDELDSLATWPAPDGHTWLLATAKSSHRLVVFNADTGDYLRGVGEKGTALGQFKRPNGIAVLGDHLFVAERDNHRVQVLALPDFTPLGSFGEDALRSPYGLWLVETGPDELEAYVTDSFMDGARYDMVPPFDQLDKRVHRFHIEFDDDRFTVRDDGAFGSTDPATALRMVESIAGDPASGRLLIADEDARHGSTLREYSFEGHATGRSLPAGTFAAEAEGVALWICTADSGYWVAVDQLYPLTRFLLFDRNTLAPRGRFTGRKVAHTDGIALHAAAMAKFPSGALFAVHDDRAVAAFDLADLVRALDLDPRCAQ